VVSGGAGNTASKDLSSVGGGLGNQATGIYATVGGGQGNYASGAYSIVPGGSGNQAQGDISLAVGHRAVIDGDHQGTFLFADSQEADFNSNNANEFGVRATGGVRFVSGIDNLGEPTAGIFLSPGGGSWPNQSDRSLKENIKAINPLQILESVAALPITEWNYRSQEASIRHIGPMAQDFYALLDIGEDDHHINSLDADGVALAAIQGLFQLLQERDDQLSFLEAQQTRLEQQMRVLTVLLIVIITTFPITIWVQRRRAQRCYTGASQLEF
jgi:hypothetical protein